MSSASLLVASLLIPLLGACLIAIFGKYPDCRETVSLLSASLLLICVCSLLPAVFAGERPDVELLELMPGVSLRLTVEPLGMLFAAVASLLWPLNSLYSIGYMRTNRETHQTRFYICFAIALSSAIGVAFSGNLLSLFVFYEVLSLSTYPLVTHKGTPEAMRAGRLYLGLLLGSSIGLFLLAIVATWVLTGTMDFRPGGILTGKVDDTLASLLLALYAFGIGKAALMPLHRWLPAAMVAPTPVSALLHAVAVVKAGVFSVVKILVYIFGLDFLQDSGAADWLVWVAAFTLLAASLIALRKDNLKARLAYSTVSQLAYVVVGAALASSLSVVGGALHIAMHACGKITLFFCAGAIYTAAHKTEISQLNGLGRVMPYTFGAFLLASLSIIGLPPFGGAWSKWLLMLGAADAGQQWMIAVLMLSSLLNVAYLLPVVVRGFFLPAEGQQQATHRIDGSALQEAPLACLIPLCITAFGCLLLFFQADTMYALLEPITRTGE